ncbi:MAG: DUF4290 domain-containing protein, partial [Muribaculaceae bacterium]|nr:DUF4290 domain-containing protein [Muribaculaceae bacterium]
KQLLLPEYGRNVQQMVDHCLTIEDREERTRCAYTIVNIMSSLVPHLREIDDFKHKLWDHLAIMSDFKLDIDYPCEIVRKESLETLPERIPYSNSDIKLRHYGKFTEEMLKKAQEMPEGEERDALVDLLTNYMKRSYLTWNKDNVEDEKIWQDIRDYTHGTIHTDTPLMRAKDLRESNPQQGKQNNNKKKKKK